MADDLKIHVDGNGVSRRYICFIAKSTDGDVYWRYFDLFSPTCEERINQWLRECEILNFIKVEFRNDM